MEVCRNARYLQPILFCTNRKCVFYKKLTKKLFYQEKGYTFVPWKMDPMGSNGIILKKRR